MQKWNALGLKNGFELEMLIYFSLPRLKKKIFCNADMSPPEQLELCYKKQRELCTFLMRIPPVAGSMCCGCNGHIHRDYWVLWRKRDSTATLSRGEHPTLALTGFHWLNLHRNTGNIWKAHQSLSGSNNQIDNIQRTLRAYFESGSDS